MGPKDPLHSSGAHDTTSGMGGLTWQGRREAEEDMARGSHRPNVSQSEPSQALMAMLATTGIVGGSSGSASDRRHWAWQASVSGWRVRREARGGGDLQRRARTSGTEKMTQEVTLASRLLGLSERGRARPSQRTMPAEDPEADPPAPGVGSFRGKSASSAAPSTHTMSAVAISARAQPAHRRDPHIQPPRPCAFGLKACVGHHAVEHHR
jgi:hypothetical protein